MQIIVYEIRIFGRLPPDVHWLGSDPMRDVYELQEEIWAHYDQHGRDEFEVRFDYDNRFSVDRDLVRGVLDKVQIRETQNSIKGCRKFTDGFLTCHISNGRLGKTATLLRAGVIRKSCEAYFDNAPQGTMF